MIDRQIRQATGPALDRAGRYLARLGVAPLGLTEAGWVFGVGACVAAGERWWSAALVGWLANRACDGLDGPVARAVGPTERGGFLDIVADFSVYSGFVVGVGIGEPAARLACLALLLAYYSSGAALLALSSLLEKRRVATEDERALRFAGGLAEGAEIIVVCVLFCLVPGDAEGIAWGFTAALAVTAGQRIVAGARMLR